MLVRVRIVSQHTQTHLGLLYISLHAYIHTVVFCIQFEEITTYTLTSWLEGKQYRNPVSVFTILCYHIVVVAICGWLVNCGR